MNVTGQTHLLKAEQLNGVSGNNLFPITVFDAVIEPESSKPLNQVVNEITNTINTLLINTNGVYDFRLFNCIKLNSTGTQVESFNNLSDALSYLWTTYFEGKTFDDVIKAEMIIVTNILGNTYYYRYNNVLASTLNIQDAANWEDILQPVADLAGVMANHVNDLYTQIFNNGTYHFEIPASIGAQDLQSAKLYVSQNVSDWSAATFDNTKVNIRNVLFVGFIDSTSNAYVQYRVDVSTSNDPYADLADSSNWNQLI